MLIFYLIFYDCLSADGPTPPTFRISITFRQEKILIIILNTLSFNPTYLYYRATITWLLLIKHFVFILLELRVFSL